MPKIEIQNYSWKDKNRKPKEFSEKRQMKGFHDKPRNEQKVEMPGRINPFR